MTAAVVVALWLLLAAIAARAAWLAHRRGREIEELRRLMNYNVESYRRRTQISRLSTPRYGYPPYPELPFDQTPARLRPRAGGRQV